MKKAPTYTAILKAIAKVRTMKQLDKVQEQMIDYSGPAKKAHRLYKKFNVKNHKIRNPINSKLYVSIYK